MKASSPMRVGEETHRVTNRVFEATERCQGYQWLYARMEGQVRLRDWGPDRKRAKRRVLVCVRNKNTYSGASGGHTR